MDYICLFIFSFYHSLHGILKDFHTYSELPSLSSLLSSLLTEFHKKKVKLLVYLLILKAAKLVVIYHDASHLKLCSPNINDQINKLKVVAKHRARKVEEINEAHYS